MDSGISTKGINFRDFLFAFTNPKLGENLLLEFFPLKVDPFRGRQK